MIMTTKRKKSIEKFNKKNLNDDINSIDFQQELEKKETK